MNHYLITLIIKFKYLGNMKISKIDYDKLD